MSHKKHDLLPFSASPSLPTALNLMVSCYTQPWQQCASWKLLSGKERDNRRVNRKGRRLGEGSWMVKVGEGKQVKEGR